MKNLEYSLINAKNFFTREGHNYVAEMVEPKKGILTEFRTKKRTYFMSVKLDEGIGVMRMDLYPGVCVPECYRRMTLEYLAPVNAIRKVGHIYIEENGTISICAQQSFADSPISEELYEELEGLLITSIELEIDNIQCVAAGNLPPSKRTSDEELVKLLLKQSRDKRANEMRKEAMAVAMENEENEENEEAMGLPMSEFFHAMLEKAKDACAEEENN